jgi:hypothetical protein
MAFPALFATVWCGITGVLVACFAFAACGNWYARLRFVRTEGTVISSEIESRRGEGGRTYRPAIRYRYVVDGTEYEGRRYDYVSVHTSNAGRAQEIVSRHPSGARVDVHYDADDPSESVLTFEIDPMWLLMFLFLQPFVLVGVGSIVWVVAIPMRYRRLRAFLDSAIRTPWRIPTWGTLTDEPAGLTIQNRSKRLRVALAVAAAYGLTCFFGTFAVAIGAMVLGNEELMVPGVVMAVGAGLGLVAGVIVWSRPPTKARLSIDVQRGAVSLTSPKRDVALTLPDVACWLVKPIRNPHKVKSDDDTFTAPLLAMRTASSEDIPVHVFGANTDAQFIASRAAEGLAELTGKPAEEAPADPADQLPQVRGLGELISMMFNFREIRRSNKLDAERAESYTDLT